MIHNKEYKEVQGTSQSPSGMLGRGRRVPDTQLPQHSESAMRPCSRTSPPRTDLFLPTLQINQKKKKKNLTQKGLHVTLTRMKPSPPWNA